MQKSTDDTNGTNGQNADRPGHVTGHNALWYEVNETGGPADNKGHKLGAMDSNFNPGVPQPKIRQDAESAFETEDANLKSELYKFDLHNTTVHSEDGELHTRGHIRVQRVEKEKSGDARRKEKSRAKAKANGWRRIELKIRNDVADPLDKIATAMNEASLHGEPLFGRVLAMIKCLEDGA